MSSSMFTPYTVFKGDKQMTNAIPVNDNFPASKQSLCALKFTPLSITQRVLQ